MALDVENHNSSQPCLDGSDVSDVAEEEMDETSSEDETDSDTAVLEPASP
jgi:hypothetical protein